MDIYIGSLNKISSRIKSRILKENGIEQRYYGINGNGESIESVAGMAKKAILPLLNETLIDYLSVATTGGDCAAPGIANMVQGELNLPPLETLSVSGICAASMGALTAAAQAVNSGAMNNAIACASEFPSRLFKSSRFNNRKDIDFDAHFLRWMLSDGAGACKLSSSPNNKKSLKLNWIHTKSFSGDYPTCMQVGLKKTEPNQGQKGYLYYPTLHEAEQDGAYDLRQDIRLLPNLFDLGFHEYSELVKAGEINPQELSAFLCHYSSEKFKPVIANLMDNADMTISAEKWFSNLKYKGNTGSASIFIILDEFFNTKIQELPAGSKILGFVPESGRLTVSFFMMEVAEPGTEVQQIENDAPISLPEVANENETVKETIRELLSVWHDYRSKAFRTPIVQAIMQEKITKEEYLNWLSQWIPQVREGSLWMRRAISSMDKKYKALYEIISLHAGEEQYDWQYLFNDYQNAGGILQVEQLKRNAGGEALNSFMHHYASQVNPIGLLGGIYIIEGTGQRIIPSLLPHLKNSLQLKSEMVRFLEYHGENDQSHLERWLFALKTVLSIDASAGKEIVKVAKLVSTLYLAQWEMAL